MAKIWLRAALLAVALGASVATPAFAQSAALTAQELAILNALPAAVRSQILALPASGQQRVAGAIASVKATVAAGNASGVVAAMANLAEAMSVVPQTGRATLAVAVATDIGRSSADAPPAVRQAAGQAITGAAAIASSPEIVGAQNVISQTVLQRITQVAEAVVAGTPIEEVISAVEVSASPTAGGGSRRSI